MAIIEIAKIQVRRGEENITGMPKLDPGEFGWAEDTENLYIGKSIVEGAQSDAPTRVLVEKDLTNIFNAIGNLDPAVATSLYKYRPTNEFLTYTTVSNLQAKLDSLNPSIYDFGVVNTSTTLDITLKLQHAVSDLFNNEKISSNWLNNDARDLRRTLIIPAGTYIVTNTVELPPYASLVGAGPDKTKIIFNNSTSNLFQTVDLAGHKFESNIMQSGIARAREVYIGNMTIEFSTASSSNNSLISLDNVFNAQVENCVLKSNVDSKFTNVSSSAFTLHSGATVSLTVANLNVNYFAGQHVIANVNTLTSGVAYLRGTVVSFNTGTGVLVINSNPSTQQFGTGAHSSWEIKIDDYLTTYGYAIHGTGIQIRGTGTGVISDINLCENIVIKDCTFDGLNLGVLGNGAIVNTRIENNTFNNLDRGVQLQSPDMIVPGPTNAQIVKNRFQNIIREGLYVGDNVGNKPTYHVSEGNAYIQVGNGLELGDLTTISSTCTSVIKFLPPGNKSINDYFSRRTFADATTDPTFYYYPIIAETAMIRDDAIFSATIYHTSASPLCKFYVTGFDQKIDLNYQITGNGLSRKGTLLVNLSPKGFGSLSENYNYSQSVEVLTTTFTVTSVISPVSFSIAKTTATMYMDAINASGKWYIVSPDDDNVSGVVSSVTTSINDYTFVITPDPVINFNTPGLHYSFAFGDFEQPTFSLNSSTVNTNNYVKLEMISNSVFDMNIEYRKDQQT